MKVLIVNPNSISFHGNTFWKFSMIYEMEQYLKKHEVAVDLIDLDNQNLMDLVESIVESDYGCILISAIPDITDGLIKTIKAIRIFQQDVPIFVYGLSTLIAPERFQNLEINGFSATGFYEIAALSFIKWVENPNLTAFCCSIKNDGVWITNRSVKPNAESWSFMSVEKALQFYNICLTVSKGCKGSCYYCSHLIQHGTEEIRKSTTYVVNYMEKLIECGYNGKITFAAPTFTSNAKWINNLCDAIINREIHIPWNAVTRADSINKDGLSKMYNAGCYKISIGVESLNPSVQKILKKNTDPETIHELYQYAKKLGMELSVYLIYGFPKQSIDEFLSDLEYFKKRGINVKTNLLVDVHWAPGMDYFDYSLETNLCSKTIIQNLNKDSKIKLVHALRHST